MTGIVTELLNHNQPSHRLEILSFISDNLKQGLK